MVYQKVVRILANILDLDEEDITPEIELTPEFEIEKIHIAKLVIKCEKKFKITIHDEKVYSFRTIKDIAKYIENTLSENEGNTSESSEEERMGWYYS
nr:phosphopantetheine-binding protein [Sedimentibacter sp.]